MSRFFPEISFETFGLLLGISPDVSLRPAKARRRRQVRKKYDDWKPRFCFRLLQSDITPKNPQQPLLWEPIATTTWSSWRQSACPNFMVRCFAFRAETLSRWDLFVGWCRNPSYERQWLVQKNLCYGWIPALISEFLLREDQLICKIIVVEHFLWKPRDSTGSYFLRAKKA